MAGRGAMWVVAIACGGCHPQDVPIELPSFATTKSLILAPYAELGKYARIIAIDPAAPGARGALEALHPLEDEERHFDLFVGECTLAELGLEAKTYLPAVTGEPLVVPGCVFGISFATGAGEEWLKQPSMPVAARSFSIARSATVSCDGSRLMASCP
jgi:hypothetical protein